MKQRTTQVLLLGLLAAGANAHAALNPGDLAFTAFNADEDGWALVALQNIDPNTTIFFRDDEWNGSAIGAGGAFNAASEGSRTWNTGASLISAGTVVRFSQVDKPSAAASIGSLTQTGDTGLNATDETLYAYLGSDVNTPTTFLAAITNNGSFTNATGTLNNTGLFVDGSGLGPTALALTASADFGQYTGARNGAAIFTDYASFVNVAANWSIIVGGSQELQVPNTTAFTVTPIPEASEYMMMLFGLGLVGAVAAKRRRTVG